MKHKKPIEQRIRGWLPQDRSPRVSRIANPSGLRRKLRLAAIFAASAALAVCLFFAAVLVLWTLNPIVPTDTRIINTLNQNKDSLLSIDGVIGAGIARNSTNHILGIVVYVEDSFNNSEVVPKEMGGFTVLIVRTDNANRNDLIIRRQT